MTTYETKKLERAAFLATYLCLEPNMFRDQFDGRVIFEFEHRLDEIEAALDKFETNTAIVHALQLFAKRRHLCHDMRIVLAGGRL